MRRKCWQRRIVRFSVALAMMSAIGGEGVGAAKPTVPDRPLAGEIEVLALLDSGRFRDASRKIDLLVEARLPPNGKARPDAVLDRLIGEVSAVATPRLAEPMLLRATADPSTSNAMRYRLLLGRVQESLNKSTDAERLYRQILAGSQIDERQRQKATVGLARILLARNPAEARLLLSQYLERPPEPKLRWEAELLAARVERMTGRAVEAQRLLDNASQHAWSAPLADVAIERIAIDRAVVAGLMGDRETIIAMLGTIGAGRPSYPSASNANLPTCGIDGVEQDDFVILEVVSDQWGVNRADLVHASRPGIAEAFLRSYRGRMGRMLSQQAMPILLRCATAPRGDAQQGVGEDIVASWAMDHFLYPVLPTEEQTSTGALVARLAAREARYGKESPLLVPVLYRLANQIGSADDAVDQDRLATMNQQLLTILTKSGASGAVRAPVEFAALMRKMMTRQLSEAQSLTEIQRIMSSFSKDLTVSPDQLLSFATFPDGENINSGDFRSGLIEQTLKSVGQRIATTDPRVQALALELVQLKRQLGDEAGAAAIQRAYSLASDLCRGLYPEPRYRSSDIRSDDYPLDALSATLWGRYLTEFSLNAEGSAGSIRVISEEPPFVFRDATLSRAPTIRYEPSRIAGQPVPCRGSTQMVRWQVPALGIYD